MSRRFLALLAALMLGFGLASHAFAGDGTPGDNTAIATNTKDGSSIFKFAFDIRRITGGVVDQTNAAVAYASCRDCRTTAIAIQILLVEGSPSTFTPQNVAVAVNENCYACQTFATAYQFVVQTEGPVRFTHLGLRQIHEIKKAIQELEDANLSPAEMDARLRDLMAQLQQVLKTQLVPVDQTDDTEHDRGPPTARGKTETATSPADTTSSPTSDTPTTTTTTTTTGTTTTTTTTPTTTATPTTTTAPTTTNATTTTTP